MLEIVKAIAPWAAIGLTAIMFIIFMAAMLPAIKSGSVKSISAVIGKARIDVQGMDVAADGGAKEAHPLDKNLLIHDQNATLYKAISDIDGKMIDKAIIQTDQLRRKLLYKLGDLVKHPFSRHTISYAICQPLYHAARRNKFRVVLLESNIGKYVSGLIEEMKLEYADYQNQQSNFTCPTQEGQKCGDFPPWNDLDERLRIKETLLEEWAWILRNYRIKNSQEKNEVYGEYLQKFKALGAQFSIAKTEQCIAKNNFYISELTKRGGV